MNRQIELGKHEKFFNIVNPEVIAQPTEDQKKAFDAVSQAGIARQFALFRQGGFNRLNNPVDYTLSDKEYNRRKNRRQMAKNSRKANRI
jgi:hypothetical protein